MMKRRYGSARVAALGAGSVIAIALAGPMVDVAASTSGGGVAVNSPLATSYSLADSANSDQPLGSDEENSVGDASGSAGKTLSKADVNRVLRRLASARGGAKVIVSALNDSARKSAAALAKADRRGQVRSRQRLLAVSGAYTAQIDAKALAVLKRAKGIRVEPNIEVPPTMTTQVPIVEADDMYNDGGTTGTNQVVAVIDTGVDSNHTWFRDKIVTEVCFSATACPDGTNSQTGAGAAVPCPWAGCDHGTHVAGILAGGRATAADRGIATGARIIPIMAASRNASNRPVFQTADLISALQWVNSNAAEYNIVAVNMSLGGPLYAPGSAANPLITSCANSSAALTRAVRNLDEADIATVIAAGNEGFAGNLDYPSCLPRVVSVAATTDADALAAFSNRAPTVTLAAPGNQVSSAVTTTAANRSRMGVKNGTSMATPMVSGAYALLRQRWPGEPIDELTSALRASSTLIRVDGGATILRRINIHRAQLMLKNHPQVADGSGGGSGRVTAEVGAGTETISFNGTLHRFWFDSTNANLRQMVTNGWGQDGNVETLDGNTLDGGRLTGDVGREPSAVVHSGTLHVFYRDATRGNLRHASFNGARWSFENVETAGDVGGAAEAAVYNNELNVFHYDRVNADLRRCVLTAGAWQCGVMDGDANANMKIAARVGSEIESLNWGTSIYVFYRDDTNNNLRYGYLAPHRNSWNLEVLDGDGGGSGRTNANVGTGISAGLFLDRPVVFYSDRTNNDLRIARGTLAGWELSVLDGNGGDNGRTTNSVGTYTANAKLGGVMHVFYYDSTRADLRVASVWDSPAGLVIHAAIVDGVAGPRHIDSGSSGRYVSAATFNDEAQLTYEDATNRDTKVSRFGN